MGIASLAAPLVLSSMIGAGASVANTASTNAGNASLNKVNRDFAHDEAEIARNYNSSEASTARAFNAQQGDIARGFAEKMSSTAVQRQAADMKAAGINPIMAAHNGASSPQVGAVTGPAASGPGASTPGSLPMQKSDVGNIISRMGEQLASTSLEAKRLKKDNAIADSTIRANEAAKVERETQATMNVESAKRLKAETQIREAEAIIKNSEIGAAKAENKWREKLAPYNAVGKPVGNAVGTAATAIGGGFIAKKLLTSSFSARQIRDRRKSWIDRYDDENNLGGF